MATLNSKINLQFSLRFYWQIQFNSKMLHLFGNGFIYKVKILGDGYIDQ